MEAFGWRLRHPINEMLESTFHNKTGQNLSNKENNGLRNLIHAKNNHRYLTTLIKTWVQRTQTKNTWFFNAQDNYRTLKHIENLRKKI